MKKKIILLIFIIEIIIMLTINRLFGDVGAFLVSCLGMPVRIIAVFLKKISEFGSVANGFAVMLSFGIAGLPTLYSVIKPEKSNMEKVFLWITSAFLTISICIVSKVRSIDLLILGNDLGINKLAIMVISAMMWIPIIGYFSMKILKGLKTDSRECIALEIKRLLLIFTLCIGYELHSLFVDIYVFGNLDKNIVLLTNSISKHIGDFVLIGIILKALDFSDAILNKNRAEIVKISQSISKTCVNGVFIMMLFRCIPILFQLLYLVDLRSVNIIFEIPVIYLIIIACIYLITNVFVENKSLSEENELII